MATERDYLRQGPCLVKVKGAAGSAIAAVQELGLATDQIRIMPRWKHRDIFEDSFGPDIPPETMWLLADVMISMTLNHVDLDILKACINESMGGSSDGTLVAAGRPMGGGVELFEANNHYISLNLLGSNPWRFRACYLQERPVEWPVGTIVSNIQLNWRAIPYAFPKAFPGSPGEGTRYEYTKYALWDRNIDQPPVELG